MHNRAHAELPAEAQQAPNAPALPAPIPLTARRRRRAFLRRLERMSPEQRLRAARKGRFSRGECALWAARYPGEAPLVNGEYPWIALALADLD
jgi:hypothetical protein